MSLDDLKRKISEAQHKLDPEEENTPPPADSMNKGIRILTELIGIMLSCGFIGYGLDYLLGTSPGFLLGFLVVGMITFFYNLMKYVKK